MKKIFLLFAIYLLSQQSFGQTFRWAYRIGGPLLDKGQQLLIDSSDNLYSIGLFNDTVDFNPGISSTIFNNYGSADIYVTKSDTSGNMLWARQYANNSPNECLNAAIDKNQNLGMTGYFRSGMDANPSPVYTNYLVGPGFNTLPQIFRLGLTPSGTYQTSFKQISATANDLVDQGKGYGIAFDPFNGLYTTGFFRGTVDFADGPSTLLLSTYMPDYDKSMYVYRQDSSGNKWALKLGSNSYDSEGRSITSDQLGNCYVTGVFSGAINFNPNTFPSFYLSGGNDIPIAKYDTAANFLWARKVGGSGYDVGIDIKLDKDENVYITGSFQNIVDFDPGVNVYNLQTAGTTQSDAFILKLDSSGNFLWVRKIGGNLNDEGRKIVFDSYNNVYILGIFRDSVNFDTDSGQHYYLGKPNFNYSKVFISKYSHTGVFNWTKVIEGNFDVDAGSIAIGSNDEIYVNGSFMDTIDIDPSASTHFLYSEGNFDIFTLKLSDCGSHYTTQTFVECDSITIDSSTYFHSGYYTHLYNTTQGCDSNVVYNVIINYTTSNALTIIDCDSTSINGQTYTNSGTYLQTLNNAQGCDSILTLNLTINHATSYSISQTGCDSITINGQTYTSSGTYLQTLTNAQGCDSLLTLNLTINHTSYQSITLTACDSIVINGQTFTTSGIYTQTFTNIQNCDSILTINLTINQTTNHTISQTACDSVVINGQTYYTSSTYLQTLTNAQGCDSLLTLNLTINNATNHAINQTACDSVVINGQTYNTSGTYLQTLTNAQGCDSLLILNVTIKQTTSHAISQSACQSLTINGQTYTTTGTYLQTLTNAQGCDSLLTINANVTTINNTVTQVANTLTSNETGATYQWLSCNPYIILASATNPSYSPTANGDYAVEINKNGCTDTSACRTVIVNSINDLSLIQQISIFPNPFNHKFQLSIDVPLKNATIQVLSIIGEVVYQLKNTSGTLVEIDLGKNAGGVYVVEVKEDNKAFRMKVVKTQN